MKLNDLRIAIDGGAATGKSSVSKLIANKIGVTYLNTGDLYRLVALFCLKNNILIKEKNILKELNKLEVYFENNKIKSNFLFEYDELHSLGVSQVASIVSSYKGVRDFLFNVQRDLASKKGVLLEGRDIGTKIMPDADIKFFLTVNLEVGAQRRFNELKGKVSDFTLESVKKELEKRNENDSGREISPLKKASDAIEIDTSNLTKDEVVEKIYNNITTRFKSE